MTAQTVTRDEFEDVKQLLASAARYAESANRRLDQVMTAQATNTLAIAALSERIDRLGDRLNQLSVTVESLAQEAAQDRSQAQIDRAEFRTTVTQLLEVLTRQFNGNGRSEG